MLILLINLFKAYNRKDFNNYNDQNDQEIMSLINLLNYSRKTLSTLLEAWNEPVFRANQLIQWIHQRGVSDFDEMTDLSRKFRDKLKAEACVLPLEILFEKTASDDTKKFLFKLIDVNAI